LDALAHIDGKIVTNERGNREYHGDTFRIELFRYSDPDRLNLADSAAIYLGKEDTDNVRRPLSIMKLDHALEIFRGENATFKFYNVSKQVYDHLVTYKTLNMRAAGGNRALVSYGYTLPSDRMKDPDEVQRRVGESMRQYLDLVEAGETKQVARAAMPVAANMNPFKLQFNFQTLIESLFVQRIWEPGAQGNTVKVVRGMFALCHAADPELWETVYELYGPHVKAWKLAQRRIRNKSVTVGEFLAALEEKGAPVDVTLDEAIREVYGGQKSMW
jgi:hypothetical protein